jgi:hypothetical protein
VCGSRCSFVDRPFATWNRVGALTSCFFCSAFIAATLASISARFAALAASSIVCELVWVRLFAPQRVRRGR